MERLKGFGRWGVKEIGQHNDQKTEYWNELFPYQYPLVAGCPIKIHPDPHIGMSNLLLCGHSTYNTLRNDRGPVHQQVRDAPLMPRWSIQFCRGHAKDNRMQVKNGW